jgi:hypothetical protein
MIKVGPFGFSKFIHTSLNVHGSVEMHIGNNLIPIRSATSELFKGYPPQVKGEVVPDGSSNETSWKSQDFQREHFKDTNYGTIRGLTADSGGWGSG